MKSVEFDHKGKVYSLRLDLRAMTRAQVIVNAQYKLMGDPDHSETIHDLYRGVASGNGFDPLRIIAIFCAALDVRMTYDAACALVEEIGIRVVEPYVIQAALDSMPAVRSGEPAPAEKDGAEAGNAKTT